ncbi:MAG: NAD(P)/FAD-dependent oxidoreductase [Clostridia bacterium]|nr:NAD(P)/FAD-dependent oxidoreductase [Clostridia bacterium]
MKVIVVGGGPAGMLAAISAGRAGNEVVILEKMEKCGKKLLITGKGRCNITSSLDMSDFIANVPGNGRFLYSAFSNFTNNDMIDLLKKHGVKVKSERGNRIFPESNRSLDVLNALLAELKECKVDIKYNAQVVDIKTCKNTVEGVIYKDKITNKNHELKADKVIIATGGKSYSKTGSSGDGYVLAKKLGHHITNIQPSLVPLIAKEKELCSSLEGLSLRNVGISFINKENNKVIYEDFGEMVFTSIGVSGPTILSSSAHLLRVKNIENLLKEDKIILKIDLKPALDFETLDHRILKDFTEFKNKQFKNSLDELLPKKMIEPIIKLSNIPSEKRVNEITKKERQNLVELLKNFKITIKEFGNIEEAIITAGGIDIKEVNSSTMESKIINGLYFAGEILDVDAYTGGFNLQIAYSTGYTAGRNE